MKEYILEGKYVNSLYDFEMELVFFLRKNLNMPDTREDIEKEKKEKPNEDGNLNSINDYLWQLTMGNKEEIILSITNSDHIREVLGYEATEKAEEKALVWSQNMVNKGHKEYEISVENDKRKLDRAKRKVGPTLFSDIIDMILRNPKIHLKLE